MTTEELLAEVEYDWTYYFEHGHFSDCPMLDPEAEARECSCGAERAMEAIPSTLARQAASGAAVERLPIGSDMLISRLVNVPGREWNVHVRGRSGRGPTLPAAISAALGTEP